MFCFIKKAMKEKKDIPFHTSTKNIMKTKPKYQLNLRSHAFLRQGRKLIMKLTNKAPK